MMVNPLCGVVLLRLVALANVSGLYGVKRVIVLLVE